MTISKISFGSLAYTSHNLRYTIHANRFVIQGNHEKTCKNTILLNNEPIRMYGISEVMRGICQNPERYLRNGHMSGINQIQFFLKNICQGWTEYISHVFSIYLSHSKNIQFRSSYAMYIFFMISYTKYMPGIYQNDSS